MAGHSQFKNIMHRKGAQDKKRGKVFTKLIRELTTAARSGMPDPAFNPRLRAAVTAARNSNMPRDTIERAIKRGAGGEDGDNYEEIRYEGYGPGGVAVIVEALTDNRNRTAGEVRTAFTKSGGTLGETNSVSFQFSRVGQVTYPAETGSADTMLDSRDRSRRRRCRKRRGRAPHHLRASDDLATVRDALEAKFGSASAAKLVWRPQTLTPVGEEEVAQALFKLVEALEDSDDVQNVYANFDIPDDIMAKLEG